MLSVYVFSCQRGQSDVPRTSNFSYTFISFPIATTAIKVFVIGALVGYPSEVFARFLKKHTRKFPEVFNNAVSLVRSCAAWGSPRGAKDLDLAVLKRADRWQNSSRGSSSLTANAELDVPWQRPGPHNEKHLFQGVVCCQIWLRHRMCFFKIGK